VVFLLAEAADCIGHAHNHFTEASVIIHHLAMQALVEGKLLRLRRHLSTRSSAIERLLPSCRLNVANRRFAG
jgi:hypothetical protein